MAFFFQKLLSLISRGAVTSCPFAAIKTPVRGSNFLLQDHPRVEICNPHGPGAFAGNFGFQFHQGLDDFGVQALQISG